MNCMKCGREVPLGQSFCKDCLAEMDNFPIPSDTPLQLPTIPDEPPAPRRPLIQRKVRKPEEQVVILKKVVLALGISLLAVILAFAITVAVLLRTGHTGGNATLPGQNYSTSDETTEATDNVSRETLPS